MKSLLLILSTCFLSLTGVALADENQPVEEKNYETYVCESSEQVKLGNGVLVPKVSFMAPKVYEKNAPQLLLTVNQERRPGLPESYSCEVFQSINDGIAIRSFVCFPAIESIKRLTIFISKDPEGWRANLAVSQKGSEDWEVKEMTCDDGAAENP